MLRFRPIAPKLATQNGTGLIPGCCISGVSVLKESTGGARGRVAKRRFGRGGTRGRKKRVISEETVKNWPEETASGVINDGTGEIEAAATTVETGAASGFSDELNSRELVTLPLFAENPCQKISPPICSSSDDAPLGCWSNLTLTDHPYRPNKLACFNITPWTERLVGGSSITVERITDTYLDNTGEEGLEMDTLPGFTSDTGNRVKWTNRAYRDLVGQPEICKSETYPAGERGEMVALWMKEKPSEDCTAFSCRVRVKWGNGKVYNSLTAPCDVWRIVGGGGVFAWRLDVKAALCLGR